LSLPSNRILCKPTPQIQNMLEYYSFYIPMLCLSILKYLTASSWNWRIWSMTDVTMTKSDVRHLITVWHHIINVMETRYVQNQYDITMNRCSACFDCSRRCKNNGLTVTIRWLFFNVSKCIIIVCVAVGVKHHNPNIENSLKMRSW